MSFDREKLDVAVDEVTGLYTRMSFEKLLTGLVDYNKNIVVVYIDVDDFKIINLMFRRGFGNMVLKEIANIINIHNFEIVARVGSDEFLIAIIGSFLAVGYKIDVLMKALKEPLNIQGIVINISVSMGVANCDEYIGLSVNEVIENAEIAMFEAKKARYDKIVYYSDDLGLKAKRYAKISDVLKNCIANDELCLVLQPEVEIKTGNIVAFESLMRLTNKDLGIVSPSEFIPIAETMGTILQLGYWAIEQSCLMIKKLLDENLNFGVVSVNVSPVQLIEKSFVTEFIRILRFYQIEAKYIQIEITESSLINHMQDVIEKLIVLKAYGITIALDDFGVTYSSLNYLTHLPIDVIKIDKSFIDDVTENRKKQIILKALIDLSHALGYKVVAEGIENHSTMELLQANGCDIIQGYLISRPIQHEEVVEFLMQRERH